MACDVRRSVSWRREFSRSTTAISSFDEEGIAVDGGFLREGEHMVEGGLVELPCHIVRVNCHVSICAPPPAPRAPSTRAHVRRLLVAGSLHVLWSEGFWD